MQLFNWGSLFIPLIIIFFVLLITREKVTWYYKINIIFDQLEKQNAIFIAIAKQLEDKQIV